MKKFLVSILIGVMLISSVSAMEFSDVKEALNLPVEPDEFETLNGFLISLSDKIPEEGDKTVIKAYGYEFSVLEVEDKVIKQVMIKNLAPSTKEWYYIFELF